MSWTVQSETTSTWDERDEFLLGDLAFDADIPFDFFCPFDGWADDNDDYWSVQADTTSEWTNI